MKATIPFVYTVNAHSAGNASPFENYASTAEVEIAEYSSADLVPAFVVGSSTHMPEPAARERAVLQVGNRFVVPVGSNPYRNGGEVFEPFTASDLADPELAQRTLQKVFQVTGEYSRDSRMLDIVGRSNGTSLSVATFDREAKPRKGKPALSRIRHYGKEPLTEHPIVEATKQAVNFFSKGLVCVDGAIHLSIEEPWFKISFEKQLLSTELMFDPGGPSTGAGHLAFTMTEIDDVVASFREAGRLVNHTPMTVLPGFVSGLDLRTHRLVATIATANGHLGSHVHRMGHRELEIFLDIRDERSNPFRPDLEDQDAAIETWLNHGRLLADVLQDRELDRKLPENIRLMDVIRSIEEIADHRPLSLDLDEDLDFLVSPEPEQRPAFRIG